MYSAIRRQPIYSLNNPTLIGLTVCTRLGVGRSGLYQDVEWVLHILQYSHSLLTTATTFASLTFGQSQSALNGCSPNLKSTLPDVVYNLCEAFSHTYHVIKYLFCVIGTHPETVIKPYSLSFNLSMSFRDFYFYFLYNVSAFK